MGQFHEMYDDIRLKLIRMIPSSFLFNAKKVDK